MNQSMKHAVPPETIHYKYWDETERAIKQFERADEIYKRALVKQEVEKEQKKEARQQI